MHTRRVEKLTRCDDFDGSLGSTTAIHTEEKYTKAIYLSPVGLTSRLRVSETPTEKKIEI